MAYGTINADSLVSSDGGVISPNINSLRNRIINGAMMIDQRNAGASLAVNTAFQYSVDRFNGSVFSGGTGRYSLQQSTTVPAGFKNSLQMTVTTADASPSANYGYALQQIVEGLNCADLNWGSANASTVTLSFWVYSSVTGNLPVVLLNSGFDRYYATTYSVPAANTWTQIKLTIVGDTSGTWLTTNGGGIYINFGFGAGSSRTASTANAWTTSAYGGNLTSVTGATSVIATNGATFYITGVQLEKGSVATSFDYRPYGTELALCQRYFWLAASGSSLSFCPAAAYSAVEADGIIQFPVTMRATPSLIATSGASYYSFRVNGDVLFSTLNAIDSSTNGMRLYSSSLSTTIGYGGYFKTNSASSSVSFSAEL